MKKVPLSVRAKWRWTFLDDGERSVPPTGVGPMPMLFAVSSAVELPSPPQKEQKEMISSGKPNFTAWGMHLVRSHWDAPSPWQGHRMREEPARQLFLTRAAPGARYVPWGITGMYPDCVKVTGRERNLQGSSSPWGCPGGPVCLFPLSVLLLLGFLLIFGNVLYSNKASLEKSKPI